MANQAEPIKVAFIGLGVMGYPMAGHLQTGGFEVCVYNRTLAKAKQWDIKKAALYKAVKGTKVTTGDLLASTWYLIDALAAVSGLDSDLKVKNIFKSKPTAMETLAAGDEVYPLVLSEVCKGDININLGQGSIDVTDSCAGSLNQYLRDGFTDMGGTFKGFAKINESTGALEGFTEAALNAFLPIFKDNGAGAIVLTPQSDDEMICFVMMDNTKIAATQKQVYWIFSAIFEGLPSDIPLRGVQPLDLTWKVGQSVLPCIYERTVV
jgi:hypothetical protein